MPQELTTAEIQQYIDRVDSGGVDQAQQVYDILNAQGYNYAGWAAGVARGDSITGLSALSYLQGTALMGLGGDACRNLTQAQIDKIRVDMATGYLETLQEIAIKSEGVVSRDVDYKETEAFHKTALEKNRLTLDNWTLKTPFDLIRQTQGDAAADKLWEHLRDTGGTGNRREIREIGEIGVRLRFTQAQAPGPAGGRHLVRPHRPAAGARETGLPPRRRRMAGRAARAIPGGRRRNPGLRHQTGRFPGWDGHGQLSIQ